MARGNAPWDLGCCSELVPFCRARIEFAGLNQLRQEGEKQEQDGNRYVFVERGDREV